MKSELETRVFATLELRVDGGKNPTLTGHAAVFNSMSEDMGFREIIQPGAFTKTLKNNPDVRLLLNHDGLPLARTASKTLRLSEDKQGLHFVANLDPNDPDVQRILPKVQRGDLSQMSFAFRTIDAEWQTKDGEDLRMLKELDLNDGDVSLVTYPAYQATDASLRGLDAALKSRDEWHKRRGWRNNYFPAHRFKNL